MNRLKRSPSNACLRALSLGGVLALLAACSHTVESPSPAGGGAIGSLAPDLVCVEQLTTRVVVSGDGFTPMPSRLLEGPSALLLPALTLDRALDLGGKPGAGHVAIPDDADAPASSLVHWKSAQEMSFDVTPALALAPGVWDLTVTNPDGVSSVTFPGALTAVPRPTLRDVVPDLACDAQGDRKVVLHGTGLLAFGASLPGATAGGKALVVTGVDDCTPLPGTHAEGTIQSCGTLLVTVTKGTLDPGTHALVVTNPAPAACASTDPLPLVIVPPPTVASIDPDVACDAQEARAFAVTGTGFVRVAQALPKVRVGQVDVVATALDGCLAVPGTFAEGDVQSCTKLAFTLPIGALAPGSYDVAVTNPDPAGCTSTETLKLQITPAPAVAAVDPEPVCVAQGARSVTVTGSGFVKLDPAATAQPSAADRVPAVTIGGVACPVTASGGCTDVPGTFAETSLSVCTSLTVTVPDASLAAGDQPVVVTNPAPAGCSSKEAIALTVFPPPTLAGLDASAICDAQGDVTVALSGQHFAQVGAALPVVTIGAASLTPTSMSGCTAVAGTFPAGAVADCTSLTVRVAEGSLAAATYPVSVTNPDPIGCATTGAVALRVVDPPVVTGTQPASICQGGGTIHVTGQAFDAGTVASLVSPSGPVATSLSTSASADGTSLDATFGSAGQPGDTYDLVVQNAACTDEPPHQKISVVTGPVEFFADPQIVYDGINTRVTVYVTSLKLPLPANAVTIRPVGQTGPVTALAVNLVPAHPNRVEVVIPKQQPKGDYDLAVNDATGCSTVLGGAITVVDALSVSVKSVAPTFGWVQTETAVTIFRDKTAAAPGDAPFVATPRLFLNPTNPQPSDTAIPIQSVSFVDADTLTAVVPKGQAVHAYDLIVVNPDKTVGLLPGAFTVQTNAPPVVAAVTPSSLVATSGQKVTITGQSFDASTVSLACHDGTASAAPAVVSAAPACVGAACTQTATIDASALGTGSICVLRLTNADGSYYDYSAIGVTNTSLNLPAPHVGTDMTVGRRALAAAAADATTAARFVYAIGGDGGEAAANAPFASAEFAPVDLYGKMGQWQVGKYALATPRSFAAASRVGRYLYVAGGFDGSSPLATAERAQILSPREVPALDIDDIVPATVGLDAGYWFYRVSATFGAGDPDNPGGESLASDEFIVKLPSFGTKKIQVVLQWSAPLDSTGTPLPNVAGYRIYRTPAAGGASGGEVLVDQVSAATTTWTDDGSKTPGTAAPLPLGSTGVWSPLPSLSIARRGAAGVVAPDPADPTKLYFYALLGKTAATTAAASYEYLPITLLPNGHQTVGAWKTGASSSAAARWQAGAWVVDASVQSNYGADTWVFVGGGLTGSDNPSGKVEAGKVAPGGDLGVLSDTPKDFGVSVAGYGVCAANQQLFVFGGGPGTPISGAKSAALFANNNPASPLAPPTLASNGWNNEGLSMTEGRYLMGSAVQSAFIFLVGGQTAASPASTSTELVVW